MSKGPWRITFDTNPDDCNMSCVMCERFSRHVKKSPGKPRRMDFNIVKKVVEEMAPDGLKEVIPSTMGEPLLYEHFNDMLYLCHDHQIKLNLTTNGTWPHSTPESWARTICPVTSDVKVSWNGATAETQEEIMHGSKFKDRLDDLKRFISVRDEIAQNGGNRCRITLQCAFMERNLRELPALVALASELGVDRVKGHHIWVHFPELETEDLRRSPDSRRRWNQIVADCQRKALDHPLPDGRLIQLDNFLPLITDSSNLDPTWHCPFLGKEAWVNAEGRFDPCCAPDAERKQLGYFGSVLESGLKPLWEGEPYRRLRIRQVSNLICLKCNMRRPVFNEEQ
jgi:MoaA/NifB/PqqE/SkfB family radical SAM enzyme